MSAKRKAAELSAASTKKPRANASITSFFGPPKTAVTSTTASSTTGSSKSAVSTTVTSSSQVAVSTPAKWDKEAWAAKLTPEQRELLNLEIETLDESWLRELRDDICSKEFLDLKRFLKREKDQGNKVFPPEADIYSWSRHTPLTSVRVVILGQDPYHNINQAHGLAFSVRPPVPPPPSLKNIFIGLSRDYPSNGTYPPDEPGAFSPPPNNTGLLTPWADRGVLLLNTCLTVQAHHANSHATRGWENFTQKVIDIVNKKGGKFLPGSNGVGGVVFMAWGTPAGKRVKGVDASKHCVLTTVHPSPLSVHRGFYDAGHLRKPMRGSRKGMELPGWSIGIWAQRRLWMQACKTSLPWLAHWWYLKGGAAKAGTKINRNCVDGYNRAVGYILYL